MKCMSTMTKLYLVINAVIIAAMLVGLYQRSLPPMIDVLAFVWLIGSFPICWQAIFHRHTYLLDDIAKAERQEEIAEAYLRRVQFEEARQRLREMRKADADQQLRVERRQLILSMTGGSNKTIDVVDSLRVLCILADEDAPRFVLPSKN